MKLKIRNINYTFVVLILLSACSKKVYEIGDTSPSPTLTLVSKNIDCLLTAYDLTEDVSRISSKNDELILLVYNETTNLLFHKVLYQDYFTIDKLYQTKSFAINDSIIENSKLTFVLIEIDTKKTLTQIEPVVSLNLEQLRNAKLSGNIFALKEVLGDDDLIGIKSVSLSELGKKDINVDFKGIHLFDSYNYGIEIKGIPKRNKIKKDSKAI